MPDIFEINPPSLLLPPRHHPFSLTVPLTLYVAPFPRRCPVRLVISSSFGGRHAVASLSLYEPSFYRSPDRWLYRPDCPDRVRIYRAVDFGARCKRSLPKPALSRKRDGRTISGSVVKTLFAYTCKLIMPFRLYCESHTLSRAARTSFTSERGFNCKYRGTFFFR